MGAMGFVWAKAGALLGAVLGEWHAPPWLHWCGGRIGQGARAGGQAIKRRPAISAAALAGSLVLAAASYYTHAWWKARPQPIEVTLRVNGPALTNFADGGVPQSVVVSFNESVAPLSAVGKPVESGITVSPSVEGRWVWLDDRRLAFEPRNEWPIGVAYKASFSRELFAPQVRLQAYEAAFSSAPFEARLVRAEFYQDPTSPAIKKGVFELKFSHPVNTAELEKRLELRLATQAEGVLGVGRETTGRTVTYDKLKLNAYVHSVPLAVPKEATQLTLSVDKGITAQAGGGGSGDKLSASVNVPGLYGLDVTEVNPLVVTNERFEPEHVLVIRTSQLVHERDLAQAVTAWVLPLKNPAQKPEEQGDEPYPWSDTREITDKLLAASTRLPLTPVPSEREHTDTHSFKLRADVGRRVYVQVEPKFKSFGGYLMRQRAQSIVTLPAYPPELRILSEGALLPMSGEKKVAVLVRDLPGLKIEVGRVQPAQLQHLVSQSQGSYANPEFLGSFGADNMTDRFERIVPLGKLPPGKAHYEAIDLGEYLVRDGDHRKGLFLLTVSGHDPKAADVQPTNSENGENNESDAQNEQEANFDPSGLKQRRLVLVTDLGIVVKQSTDGSRDVFVQSLFTGLPVAGANVEVVARNGSTLFNQPTDANGRAHFDKLEGLKRERAPLLLMVRKGGDMSFMPLNRQDRNLDLSRFDVGGLQNARSTDELSAYLFSDRGIYRPGESMHIGMIVKAADWRRPLAGLPLEAEVLDARGLTVKRERLRLAAGGFAELSHTTLASSPTGNYTINLNIVKGDLIERQLGSTTVKVQEFMPDRMKVTAQLSAPPSEGWAHPQDLKGRVNAQNLFGTPAENRRVEATLTLSPAWPVFRAHADYRFYDPQRAKEGVNEALPEGKTDANGDAEFDLKLSRFESATYRLSLLAQVYEPEGGRSVSAETSALVSQRPFLVGVKHDGDLGFVSLGSRRVSHLIAIDPQAKKVAAPDLTLQLIERKTVSVLMRQPNDTYRYESRKKESTLSEQPLSLAAGGHALTLDTRKAGNYSYVLRDASGLELNRIDYSVAGNGNVTRSLERNAELQLTLNRKDYAPGEEIEISIRAPYVGAGLITIERDKVYAQSWFKTTTTASVQKIRLPKEFEGNGYVSVQFVRDPSSDEIFMSPLSYGVVPFATSLAQRTQTLTLAVPELTKPGQVLKVKLNASQPTRAVVFAVDEGILQVARYQMADPLGHFFQKRALEVRTAQILDLLLPEFKRLMAQSAPGGDEGSGNARFLNPFKRKGEAPAVYWSGIVDVNNGEREFNYTVPDHFNGTLRVMAVAVNEGAVGVAQSKVLVRGDFVLSPNLPLAVSPGDQFDVSVGVANNVDGSPKDAPVQLVLKPASTFELVGPASQVLKISPMRESVATFRLKVKDAQAASLGSATLEFTSTLGNKSATRRMDISVRPASPKAATLALGSFNGTAEVAVPRDLVPEFRHQEVALSALPLALAPGLMSYLDNFPHQCTEQLVSRVLPGLVLAKRPEFGVGTPQSVAKGFDEAVRVLRSRQNAQGGFGLWSASVQADEFASIYAVHMLMEARELEIPGIAVPPDVLRKGLDFAQALAASNPQDLGAARTRAYAIYLLTRNGAVTTPLVASLRETLEAKHPKVWQADLTAGYLAATYQLLKQEKQASELMDGLTQASERDNAPYRWWPYYDPVVRDTQTLYLIARHFPARLKALPPQAMSRFVAPLGKGSFNTLSSAYAVLAFEAMARTLGADALGKLAVTQLDAKGAATPLTLPQNLLPRAAIAPGTVKLKLANDARGTTTYYSATQSGFDRTPPMQELKAGMEVLREYVGADGKPVSSVKIGDEVTVRLSLRAIESGVPSVALTDLLPGGFEVVPSRDANGAASSVSGPALEYADVREERVVIYASATTSVQTYSYRLRATNSGEFVVPPAQAESMYERDKLARSVAGRITVVKVAAK